MVINAGRISFCGTVLGNRSILVSQVRVFRPASLPEILHLHDLRQQ